MLVLPIVSTYAFIFILSCLVDEATERVFTVILGEDLKKFEEREREGKN